MPARLADEVEGNGESPISSSMTRLPAAFNVLAIANTVNAVSTGASREQTDCG